MPSPPSTPEVPTIHTLTNLSPALPSPPSSLLPFPFVINVGYSGGLYLKGDGVRSSIRRYRELCQRAADLGNEGALAHIQALPAIIEQVR